MKHAISWALLAALTASMPVHAKDIGEAIDNTLTQCKSSEVSTMGIAACYNTAITAWDKELNRQYQLLLRDQPPDVQRGFRQAQRAWIKYRDAEIAAMQQFYGQERGSVWGLVMLDADLAIVRNKAIDLYRLRNSTDLSRTED